LTALGKPELLEHLSKILVVRTSTGALPLSQPVLQETTRLFREFAEASIKARTAASAKAPNSENYVRLPRVVSVR
jgi:hypothetical protein